MFTTNNENQNNPMVLASSPNSHASISSRTKKLSTGPKDSRFDDDTIWDIPLTPEVPALQQQAENEQSMLESILQEDAIEKSKVGGRKKAASRAKKTDTAGEEKPKRVRKTTAKGDGEPKAPRKPRAKKALLDDGPTESPFFANAKQSKPVSAPVTKKKTTAAPKPAAATKPQPILITSSPVQAEVVVARRMDWTPVRATKAEDEVVLLSDGSCSSTKRKASEFEGLISSLTFTKKSSAEPVKATDRADAPTTKRRCSDDGFETKHTTKAPPKPKKTPKPKAPPKPRKAKAKPGPKSMTEYSMEKMRKDLGLPSAYEPAVDTHSTILEYFGQDDITNRPPSPSPNTKLKDAKFGTFSQLARGEGLGIDQERRMFTKEELEATRYKPGSLFAAAADAPDGKMYDEDMEKYYFIPGKPRKKPPTPKTPESPEPVEEVRDKSPSIPSSILEQERLLQEDHSPMDINEDPKENIHMEMAEDPKDDTLMDMTEDPKEDTHMDLAEDTKEDTHMDVEEEGRHNPGHATIQVPSSPIGQDIRIHEDHTPMDTSEDAKETQVTEVPDSVGSCGSLSDYEKLGTNEMTLSFPPTSYQEPRHRPQTVDLSSPSSSHRPITYNSTTQPQVIDLSRDSPEKRIPVLEIADSISNSDEDYGIDDSLDISYDRLEKEAINSAALPTPEPSLVRMVQNFRASQGAAGGKKKSRFDFSDSELDDPVTPEQKEEEKPPAPEPLTAEATDISEPEEPVAKPKRQYKKKAATPEPAEEMTDLSEAEERVAKPKRQYRKKTAPEPSAEMMYISETEEAVVKPKRQYRKKTAPEPPEEMTDISETEEAVAKPKRQYRKKTAPETPVDEPTDISEPEQPAPKPKRQSKKKVPPAPEPVDPNKPNFNALTTSELTLKIKRMGLKPIKSRKGMVEMLDRCWALQHPVAPTATTLVPSSQPTTPPPTSKSISKPAPTIPSPTAPTLPLTEAIHLAITTSTSPTGQSYHLKILTYEPLLLGEFTNWLNEEGLGKVGYVDYVTDTKVRDWCDERGVCVFNSGGWSNSREAKEGKRGRSVSVEPRSSGRGRGGGRGRGRGGRKVAATGGRGRKKKVVEEEDEESDREYLDVGM